MGIGHIHLYLFCAAQGVEAGRSAGKGTQAAVGQTRSDAYCILLGNAALHKLLRKLGKGNGCSKIKIESEKADEHRHDVQIDRPDPKQCCHVSAA